MPEFYSQWSAAKSDFAKSRDLYPAGFLATLDRGADLGPALKNFDKAKSYEDRAKALASVRAAKERYDSMLRELIGKVDKKDSAAQKALKRLDKSLQGIWVAADKEGQPPRPSGSTSPHEVLRSFKLSGGYKPKFLDMKATTIDVIIEVDKSLEELIKAGEESLKIEHLGATAKAEIDKVAASFAATIRDIDASIEGLAPDEQEAKVKEANEVLKHYAKLVEDRADAAVEAEWKAYLSRRKYLSAFRLRCGIKITLGVIALGMSVASAALTFGALWMNILGAAKAVTDIAQTIKTWAQDLDSVYADLVKDIDGVQKLNLQREAAKKKGEGQKASKAGEAAKEVATGILPITKNMLKSASDVESRCKQLLGLVSKLETQSDKLTGLVNKTIGQMSKLPDKHMTPDLKKDAAKLEESFGKLLDEIADLHKKSQNCAKFGNKALAAVQKLRKEDSWSAGAMETVTGTGTKGVALFAVANFGYECAKHGATLLALI